MCKQPKQDSAFAHAARWSLILDNHAGKNEHATAFPINGSHRSNNLPGVDRGSEEVAVDRINKNHPMPADSSTIEKRIGMNRPFANKNAPIPLRQQLHFTSFVRLEGG